ncbi:hypothetical protein LTR70_000691 [Exophiala xenobiotica]|uniref:DUF7730 domain-containing protein n=1 Tax=Lithohypha guttulata TaxID=1690604 RepID=A0ABR0KNG2_9EURO|nr:hypothetical protein LTR24_000638 [Lithohypha guttulata]KAK5329194.1 hypothetical protein LTR70_000691 [Exophiala xenobiotica]
MISRTRYKPSGSKAPVSWNSRRVAEEDDEVVKPVHKATRPSQDFVEKTAALMRSIQPTARGCSRVPSQMSDAINGDTTSDVDQSDWQPVRPSRKAAEVLSTSDFVIKPDGSPESVLPQSPPSPTHKDLDHGAITARLTPTTALAKDSWVESKSVESPVMDGQLATHNGQPGTWRCVSDAPYTSHKTWFFVPDKVPAPKGRVPRPRKRKSKSKGKTTFLSLPGELRNEIYKYLIPECRILITSNKPNKELAQAKKVWSEQQVEHKRPHLRLSHLLDLSQAEQGLGITKNLLLACKQVRNDVELYLYSRTTFCFSATKALHRFLNTASKPGLRAIRKLEILHKGYGHPELTEHQVFQDKYYERWSKVCTQVSEDLSGLEHLKLEAHMRDWPCDLVSAVPNTPWRKACLQMAPRRLLKVEVKLSHDMIHRNDMALKELARRLENDMMTQEGQDERDLWETEQVLMELAARKAAKEAKAAARAAKLRAPGSLTITDEDIKKSKPGGVKVHRKGGLSDYSTVNTSKMCNAELQYFKDQYCSERHKTVST